MVITFKVVETFMLPDGSSPDDLAESIQIVADIPFRLDWIQGDNPAVKLIRLTRIAVEHPVEAVGSEEQAELGVAAAEDAAQRDSLSPQPPSYPPPNSKGREEQEEEQDWGWWHCNKGKEEQEEEQDSSWWNRNQSDSNSWWSSSSSSNQTGRWKSPCHVCGKFRSEHPDKRFCDVRAAKRARHAAN